MTEIHVNVTDQVMKLTQSPTIASGGKNEVRVVFDFCELWEGFAKTALFYRDSTPKYYAVLDEDDTCLIPWEVTADSGTFYFTVFGVKDETRRTASTLKYKVGKGVVIDDAFPSDPTPDVYDQIMADLGETKKLAEEVVENSSASIEAANQAAENANAVAQDLIEKRDSGFFDGKSVDDSKASSEYAWSSKNTVDKLCPSFTESGSVVTCEPVEGYPLEVEWTTKNLYNHNVDYGYMSGNFTATKTATGYSITGAEGGGYFILVPIGTIAELGGKRVSLSADKSGEPSSFNFVVCAPDYSNRTNIYSLSGRSTVFDLLPASNFPDGYIVALRLGGDKSLDPSVVFTYDNIQVEFGETVTAYEPYAETATITRCGKNFANVSSMANNRTTVTDGVVKVEFLPDGSRMSNYVPVYIPKGTYAILSARLVDCSEPKSTYAVGGIYAITKTGKYHGIYTKNTEIGGIMQTTLLDNDDDIVKLQAYVGQFEEAGSYIIMDNIQLEIGTKRTTYEPYNGGTFTPGEQIPALPGTNTLYADSGVITVTGKADPVAIINKLTNAILSLGGNV